ncbi:MAG TPA: UvrD-helicase domain-containing protein [Microlunatus sp.]|nr:UvrD-helicase domain-containing protein [Microlunatus sp.]
MSAADRAPAPPLPFAVCGPLPRGTTVLEASAGTGKTFTIAALAARYVAEGHATLGQLLLVTFGRMATSELRARVRERLVSVERALAAAVEGSAHPPMDDVERLLVDVPPEERSRRHANTRRALADFDAATIATTHEFCLQMLDGLGVLGDRDPERRVVEQLTDLTHEVAGDVFLRRYADAPPPLTYEEASRLAERAVEAGHARLVPVAAARADLPVPAAGPVAPPAPAESPAPPASPGTDTTGIRPDRTAIAFERTAFAAEVRAEVERRKRERRLFSYDDMLNRLRDALADSSTGDAACARLRERFAVVLVDEFQDTDPVQWDILRRAFHGHATVILIGDPKQAIYAFRGADVFSYLGAVEQAATRATLDTNWRSDSGLVLALQQLTVGAALGDRRIAVRPVRSAHETPRLLFPGGGDANRTAEASCRLRVVPGDPETGEARRVGSIRTDIEQDLVADVTALLGSGARLRLEPADEPDGRPIAPSDIAVLVRKNSRGEAIRDALIGAGVPAVLLSATSVFASPTAQEWLTLLRALEQPRQSAVRTAALTCFVGWDFARLAQADEEALVDLTWRIRFWSRLLARRGVAALLEAITRDTGLAERLLGQVGGERVLTDVRHIGQNLHAAMQGRQLGVSALVEWLHERIEDARRRSTEGSRRLDTEARCVQVLTVHASKGLQFPVVYLPEAWDTHQPDDDGQPLLLHHRGDGSPDDCLLDVGGLSGPDRRDRVARARAEEAGEDLRLLYVALTRAQCQVVSWWAPSRNTPGSALHRFLFRSRPADGEAVEPAATYPLADPAQVTWLGPGIGIEPVRPRSAVHWQPPPEDPGPLDVRRFDRMLDLEWRRTSYSALTAASHGLDLGTPAVGSEPDISVEDDEPVPTGPPPPEPLEEPPVLGHDLETALRASSPMADLPMGTEFGTAVHAALEAVDPGAEDLAAALRSAAADALSRSALGRGSPGRGSPGRAAPGRGSRGGGPIEEAGLTAQRLADALLPTLLTPLGPLADELTLAQIGARDRLAELDFELPLAGGDRPVADVRLADVAELLDAQLAPEDRLAGYPARLRSPLLSEQTLRGFLTGSIDAVLRIHTAQGPRYLVVDYKTNWLGAFDGPELTLVSYTPDRLAEAMMAAHYPLQALLYSVALHRWLRWRQPGYDPDRHLGGIAYLFVRGMAGADTPRIAGVPTGVFGWRPPPGLVPALSDLLDRGPGGTPA